MSPHRSSRRPAARPTPIAPLTWMLALHTAGWLAACGGGQDARTVPATVTTTVPAATSTATPTSTEAASSTPAAQTAPASVQVLPAYHLAPVLPGEPAAVDRDGSGASARMAPRSVDVPTSLQGRSTRALTFQDVSDPSTRQRTLAAGGVTVQASKTTVTYTPAQIRAAYGLPPVPSDLSALTPLQSAQLGAGQTIYVVDAFHDPYALGELLSFSHLFGLPECVQKTLTSASTLPLPAPAPGQSTCEFYQVASADGGSLATTYPRFDAKWATEIAMDVQWAHAIAPLARIVLIEAASDSLPAMSAAIQLANRMGPGVVSMSFAAPEGSYVSSSESLFQARGMSYFAATGDNGTAVNWPAVSPAVVAVGGTSLTYSGSGARSETAWSLAGGGVSASVATPAYQNAALLRTPAVTRRAVADVSMNADPYTGQFVAVIPNPLTCTFCQVNWVTAGGTSLSTPQWAGLAAVANAMRAQAGKAPLGAPHTLLYQALGSTSTYASAFLDVTQGSNGTCSTCTAKVGYDAPTGLGTPNGLSLVNLLAQGGTAPTAPVVIPSTVQGAYGQALSFTPSVSSPDGYTLAISSAPAGVAVSGSVVNWPNPVAGTFSVKVTAKGVTSGLSGTGTYTLVIAPPPPPIVSSGTLTATAGKPFSVAVSVNDRYPTKLSLVGAPAGMSLSSSGQNGGTINWSNPVVGTYRFSVKADSTQTGLSSAGSYTIAVSPAGAPQVATGQVSTKPGVPWSMNVGVVAANAFTLSLSGAPSGMAISATGTLSWAKPVEGSYAVAVQAKDSKTGVVGTGIVNVTVGGTTGPAVFSTVLTGTAGKPFTGTVFITDASAGLSGVSFGATHPSIKFTTDLGMAKTTLTWDAPVAGTYAVAVSATDTAGKSVITVLPLVISK